MSEKKKEIHVKDLVIKADNVYIEPKRRHDPFFGPRQRQEEIEDVHDVKEKLDDEDHFDDDKKDDDERHPFSWL
ncbi:hypothetical protein [Gracilibacillus sp. YIM 98692]|uniref:hypothetical protein n=1 Tax=Gracilibacillus sp. YIM 98692 TaxID=2663532 RepID=UPI0013D2356F|nr:hypothetical protein [Gracilibacillus sp. YIM 98692]